MTACLLDELEELDKLDDGIEEELDDDDELLKLNDEEELDELLELKELEDEEELLELNELDELLELDDEELELLEELVVKHPLKTSGDDVPESG